MLGAASEAPAFVIALSLGAALVVAASAALALTGHNERGEWLLFIFAFAAALPASLLGAWHLSRSGRGTWLRATAAGGGLAFLVGLARLLPSVDLAGKGSAAVLVLTALGLCAVVLLPLGTPTVALGRTRLLPPRRIALGLATVALAGLLLAFAPSGLPDFRKLAFSAFGGVGMALLYWRVRPLAIPGRMALALDLIVSAAVVLLVVDVVGYTSDGPRLSSGGGLAAESVVPAAQLHLDYYLGPVNDVLHGRPLLVDSACQYGVLNLYLLAAWFQIAPLGYGPLGFAVSLVTAAQYLVAYWVLRLAGSGPVIAGAAMLVAVAVTVLAGFGSPAFFPSTGGLRFGLPFVLILITLLAARRSRSAPPISVAAFAVVGLSSLWSFETLVYVLAAFAAAAAFDIAIRSRSLDEAARLAGRHMAGAAVALVGAHLLFAIGTRLLAGSWPDWGWYLDYFETYSTGGLSQALARPWSLAWLIGATCFASIGGLVALAATNRAFAMENRVPLLAAAGTSGAGVAMLTYFLGRSIEQLLVFVALPAFMLGAIWLALALQTDSTPRAVKVAAVGFCSWVAALSFALAWPQASDRWPRTAVAHLPPGGRSLSEGLERLWDSPAMDPRSPAGERLIRDHFPPSSQALVIAEPSLAAEILVRTDRVNALPISFPFEDDLVLERSVRRVRDAVARLDPGTPMLLQRDALSDVSNRPAVGVIAVIGGKRLSEVQLAAYRSLKSRFEFEPVATGGAGLQVVTLRAKRRS